jgi:hypothetical protein
LQPPIPAAIRKRLANPSCHSDALPAG